MSHTIHGKKKLLARVRRIKGQAGALESALEQESDCAAILQQIAAIRGAVNGLMLEVLEGHMREHLGAEEATPAAGGSGSGGAGIAILSEVGPVDGTMRNPTSSRLRLGGVGPTAPPLSDLSPRRLYAMMTADH